MIVLHDVEPQAGDAYKLKTICTHCGQVAYWRIGAGIWEHAA